MSLSDLAARTLPFLQQANLVGPDPDAATLSYIGHVLKLEQERMKTLADAPGLADFFLLGDDEYVFDEQAVQKRLAAPRRRRPPAPRPRRLRRPGRF